MRYLTVQDMIWIHSLVSKGPQNFDYLRLEEATYYQYGYGQSQDPLGQAARFLTGFNKMAPFANANGAAAFVGFGAFLLLNGKRLKPDAAKSLMGEVSAEDVRSLVEDEGARGPDSVREAIAQVFEEHAEAIAGLCAHTSS